MLRYQPRLAERVAVGLPFDGPDAADKSTAMRELLFQHGMDVNLPNWLHIAALHRFAKNGDVKNAAVFIDHGADLNARDEELSSTPLGWAAKYGRLDMVNLLLERGADPNLPGGPAWATPLAWAKRRGNTDIVELLLKWKR